MNRRDARWEPELEALLKPRKIQRQAPPEIRARALAWARAFATGAPLPIVRPSELRLPPSPLTRIGLAPLQFAVLASVAVAGGAVGTALTLSDRRADPAPREAAPVQSTPAMRAPLVRAAEEPAASSEPLSGSPPVTAVEAPRTVRSGADADALPSEFDLLARAQAAYTHHDFSRALALVAEHTRRFPSGHLAEEREALRVRSLLGSGRSEDAERAAAAFARRFPRSVLLPRARESLSTR